ncbi:MAG: VOC family protein [Alphaproteobacteria bacterium]|nr:VOC family protein [Alphaproteobacteria bacterium]
MAKLRHLGIITVDPEKLARFYSDVFEMEIIHRSPAGAVYMSDGVINLALLPNTAEGKPSGLNHFGFHVEDAEEIGARLAAWNVAEPRARPSNRPYAETRTTDPDGNNIDLSVHGYQTVEYMADRGGEARSGKLEKIES